MQSRRVYVAGPIAKPSRKKGRYGKNIVPAMNMWSYLWSAGFTPYCPHLSYFMERHLQKEFGIKEPLSHAEWLEQDYAWLKLCHAVIRLPGESVGADMEQEYAMLHGIPVFTELSDLMEWDERNPL